MGSSGNEHRDVADDCGASKKHSTHKIRLERNEGGDPQGPGPPAR